MEPSDIQLMLCVKRGDVEAFRRLAARYREPLRRYFAALVADQSQADDLAQETLVRLWSTRDRYEPAGKFSTFLFQIGKYYWLNQRKKFRLELTTLSCVDGINGPSAPASLPETIVMERLRIKRIHRAIAALPQIYRSVFRLCHEEGLRYREIANRLNIPIGTVKSRMSEALKRLRQALSLEEELIA